MDLGYKDTPPTGKAARQKGMPVAFVTAASLVNELMEVRDEKRLLRLQRQLAKVSLLIIPLGTLLRNALPGSG
jgi:DNA replication protein DnaC